MSKCFCRGCNNTFKSEGSFNKHRVGTFGDAIYKDGDTKRKNPIGQGPSTRRCMTQEEMKDTGMAQNDKGWWVSELYDASAHGSSEDNGEEGLDHAQDDRSQ